VAEAVALLGLQYVVLTAVARDDLDDGGAGWFVATIAAIRAANPQTQVEVLTPDFWSGKDAHRQQQQRIATVVGVQPACYNHNVETVSRLQDRVRRGAKYQRSLDVLGHGETEAEIIETLQDLRAIDCDRVTLGQYMRPSLEHLPVVKYWTPAEFDRLGEIARELGFKHVRSAPLVRSSYHAGE
jgi:lipoyl synthase